MSWDFSDRLDSSAFFEEKKFRSQCSKTSLFCNFEILILQRHFAHLSQDLLPSAKMSIFSNFIGLIILDVKNDFQQHRLTSIECYLQLCEVLQQMTLP